MSKTSSNYGCLSENNHCKKYLLVVLNFGDFEGIRVLADACQSFLSMAKLEIPPDLDMHWKCRHTMIHAPPTPKRWILFLDVSIAMKKYGKDSPCFNFCASCLTCSSLWNGHTWAPLLKHINMNHQLCHYVPHPSHAIHEMGLQREAYNVKVVDGCATVLVKLVIFGLQTVNICPSSWNRFSVNNFGPSMDSPTSRAQQSLFLQTRLFHDLWG